MIKFLLIAILILNSATVLANEQPAIITEPLTIIAEQNTMYHEQIQDVKYNPPMLILNNYRELQPIFTEITYNNLDEADEDDIAVFIKQSLDEYRISYYCIEQYPHICNAGSPYLTRNGNPVIPDYTIATDDNVIPLGSFVLIDNKVYLADDTGGNIKGKRLDIAVETHQEAIDNGIEYKEIYLMEYVGYISIENNFKKTLDK